MDTLLPEIVKENIMFYPWVGKNYFNGGGSFNKKILILGESGYCPEQCECCFPGEKNTCNDKTIKVINEQISDKGKKHSIFTKLTKLFLDKESVTMEEKAHFFNSIAYYNYIQTALSQPRKSPELSYWQEAEEPFKVVVDFLKPDLLLVLGERLWENMPGQCGVDWPEGPFLSSDEITERTWFYKGVTKNILTLNIYHPSSSAFTYKYIPIIKEAIRLA